MPATVILGAGIIGLSTAFYLSRFDKSQTIHLVESSPTLFASASGKAAGFLAKDWFSSHSAALGSHSFDLHKALALEFDGKKKWGYSPSVSYSLDQTNLTAERGEDWLLSGTSRASVVRDDGTSIGEVGPSWLTSKGALRQLSNNDSTAQVDPLRLCGFLLKQCVAQGVHLHHPAKASKILTTADSILTGIQLQTEGESTTVDIPCDNLVLACGAWTTLVFRSLFPSATRIPQITSLAGHSVVIESSKWSSSQEDEEKDCHAVFTTNPSGFSPEIFSRIGGEIWLGGLNDSAIPLPELATGVEIDAESIKTLVQVGKELCGDDVEIIREGLCHRPVTKTGAPFVGQIDEKYLGGAMGRVFVASGHGPWGISLSLGTGWVVAEMVQGKTTTVDVRTLGRL